MRRIRKVVVWLVTVVMATSLVFSLGQFAQAQDPVKLTLFSTASRSFEVWVKETAAQFSKETGIEVVVDTVPWGKAYAKMMLDMSQQTGAIDVVQLDFENWFMGVVSAGYLEPLDEFLADPNLVASDFDMNDFLPLLVEKATYEGKVYGIPMYANVLVGFYRKDLFEEKGLQYPQSLEEFVETAKKLTLDTDGDGKTDIYGATLPLKKHGHLRTEFLNWLWSFGGDLFDENWNPTLNSEAGVKALQAMVDMYQKDKSVPPGSTGYTYSDGVNLFLQGTAAMTSWWVGILPEVDNPEVSKIVGKSALTARPGISRLGGYHYSIPKDSKHKKEAFRLIQFLTGKGPQKVRTLELGILPQRKSLLFDPEVLAKYPDFKLVYETFATSRSLTGFSEWSEVDQLIRTACSSAAVLEKTPKQALDDAAEKIRKIMEKAGYYK